MALVCGAPASPTASSMNAYLKAISRSVVVGEVGVARRDVPINPRLTGEFRLEGQQLYDQTSNLAAGWIGAQAVFQGGIRYTP
ncbi:MAG: hypothetical protein ACREMW_14470 [Gemmatimonadales bacterium]